MHYAHMCVCSSCYGLLCIAMHSHKYLVLKGIPSFIYLKMDLLPILFYSFMKKHFRWKINLDKITVNGDWFYFSHYLEKNLITSRVYLFSFYQFLEIFQKHLVEIPTFFFW